MLDLLNSQPFGMLVQPLTGFIFLVKKNKKSISDIGS
jgi:hypothetical protein